MIDIDEDVKQRANTRFRNYHVLRDYFMLVLKNGARVRGVVAMCGKCQGKIADDMLRGEVREAVANCYRVTAIGRCGSCDWLTPFLFHIVPVPGDAGYELVALDSRGWLEMFDERRVVQFKRKERESLVADTA